MRISPIQARLEVAGIQKTAPVARSSQAILPEEEEDDDDDERAVDAGS